LTEKQANKHLPGFSASSRWTTSADYFAAYIVSQQIKLRDDSSDYYKQAKTTRKKYDSDAGQENDWLLRVLSQWLVLCASLLYSELDGR